MNTCFPVTLTAHFLGSVFTYADYIHTYSPLRHWRWCAHSLALELPRWKAHTHTRRTCRYTFVDLYRYRAVLQLAWTLLSLQPNTGNKVSNFLFRPRSSGVGVSPEMYYYSSAVSRVNVCVREREREPLLRKSIISRGRPRCVEIMQVPFLLGMPRAHSPPPD
jgi:hypothetical protein